MTLPDYNKIFSVHLQLTYHNKDPLINERSSERVKHSIKITGLTMNG